jgi:hypothetical protein
MRKESSHNAGFEPGRMNAQMSKHRIDPPAAMVLDGVKAAAAGARPDFRNQGTNLIVGNFRLDLPDQVLTVVMGETKVDVSSGRSMKSTTVECKLPASSIRSTFNVHFIENPSARNSSNDIHPSLIDPQLLSSLEQKAERAARPAARRVHQIHSL